MPGGARRASVVTAVAAPVPGRRPVRSHARVVRTGNQVAFVVFDAWRAAAITVTVPSAVLQQALGLTHDQLADAQATAVINPGALLDDQVRPRAWRPATEAPQPPAPRFRPPGSHQ